MLLKLLFNQAKKYKHLNISLKIQTFQDGTTKSLLTIFENQKSVDHYAKVIIVFAIMFSSTLLEKSTLINLNLEKNKNIKDFLEMLNHFLPLFSKLCIKQNYLQFLFIG